MKYKIIILFSLSLISSISFGRTAPDFRAERLSGGVFHLNSALNDKYILLHFWDTCCPGCREALPAVDSVANTFKDSVKVISVSIDSPKTQSKIKPFLKTHRYTFDVILDPNLEIRRLFGGTETPFTVIIAPSGEILHQRTGATVNEVEILSSVISDIINRTPKH